MKDTIDARKLTAKAREAFKGESQEDIDRNVDEAVREVRGLPQLDGAKKMVHLVLRQYENGSWAVSDVSGTHYNAPLEQILLELALSLSDRFKDVSNYEDAIKVRQDWLVDVTVDMIDRQHAYEVRAKEEGIY